MEHALNSQATNLLLAYQTIKDLKTIAKEHGVIVFAHIKPEGEIYFDIQGRSSCYNCWVSDIDKADPEEFAEKVAKFKQEWVAEITDQQAAKARKIAALKEELEKLEA